jgi:hypothetical protein
MKLAGYMANRSLPTISLKDKYRQLISAMTPTEKVLLVQEASQFTREKRKPRIMNERFLRKTIPMGFSLSDNASSAQSISALNDL